jgi:hypothetical protein
LPADEEPARIVVVRIAEIALVVKVEPVVVGVEVERVSGVLLNIAFLRP